MVKVKVKRPATDIFVLTLTSFKIKSSMQQINAVDFQKEVINSPIPVLVDFFATWCGPCQMQAPVLEDLSKTWENKVKIVKIDVDQNQELAGQWGVMSIPTMIIFKTGQPANQMIGFQAKEKLETVFAELSSH